MQKPISFPQNYLLSHVIRFLHGKESNFENIKTLIDQSSINHSVLTFSFLIKWLPKHLIDESTAEMYNDSIQFVIQIIGLIIQKVPPVILYHKLPENEIESADCSHWLVSELLEPIKQRMMRLRSYILPNNTFRFHCLIPQIFSTKEGKKDHKLNDEQLLRIEKNIYPNFEAQVLKYMKSLIINHVPIHSFQSLSSFQHSRIILTNVIIQLLEELNQTRQATHEELLFAFSSIFLYIYALAFNNEIDGQVLCTYIRSRSFLSPFCILGMVKYIISYLYLFNLLTPKEFIDDNSEIQENQKTNRSSPYTCVDLTNDKTLSPLVSKIPLILQNYFLPKTVKKENSSISNDQDDKTKFYIYMHLSTVELGSKMRTVFIAAKEKLLTPTHVYSMGVLLLRYVIFSLQRTLVNFVDKEQFTPNFSAFVKTVFSVLTTTFSEPLASKFYDSAMNDPKIINVTISGSFIYLLPLILRSSSINHLTKYCLKATNDDEIALSGRIMITKILQCDYPKNSLELIQDIKETRDLVTLLSYINAMTNFKFTRNFKEANKIEESRLIFLNQLIIGNTYVDEKNNINGNGILIDEKPFIFRPFKALSTIDRQFNKFSKSIIQASESPTQVQSMNDLICSLNEEDQPWVIYYFSMTACIENESFAETITDQIIAGLGNKDSKKNIKANNFILSKNDHYYVVSQTILGRLVSFNYTKAAVRLSQSMIPYLSTDMAALHYITNFLAKYRPICPIGVLDSFQQVVSNLPYSDEYYNLNRYFESTTLPIDLTSNIHSNFVNKVFAITKMLDEYQCKIIQNPDVITREYQSPFQHAMAFAICSLGLITSLQAADSTNLGVASAVNEMPDPSMSLISNSFDFDGGQNSFFGSALMDFDVPSNFDSGLNNPSPSTCLNNPLSYDSNPPKQTTNSNVNEIVPQSITDEIAEALLSPITCFTRVWQKRDVAIKLCSLIAAKLDNRIATKFLDLLIKGDNNELYIMAGITFLMNCNLNILEYACQSLTNYITDFNTNFSNHGNNNYNAKINFFFKILMPSVWRIQGEKRVGMILMDGILKSITKQTPKKMFNTVIDIISYVYLKLELYEYRIQIIKFAVSSGYSPEMIMLIESSLPVDP